MNTSSSDCALFIAPLLAFTLAALFPATCSADLEQIRERGEQR